MGEESASWGAANGALPWRGGRTGPGTRWADDRKVDSEYGNCLGSASAC